MSEILCITVQCDPIFHSIPLGPCLGMPMKDTSPKARKSQEVMAGFAISTAVGVRIPNTDQQMRIFLQGPFPAREQDEHMQIAALFLV